MAEPANKEVSKIVDHLFRTEAGKMVAVLTRVFGFANIEQAEDIVHDTIIKALETWKQESLPENPQAWLYRAAKNRAIDLIRREQLKYKIENELAVLLSSEYTLVPKVNEMFTEGEIKDSQLRMMFACCHPSVSAEAQITLILKTLCGLSVKEISNAFLTNEETITKRLYRTKEKIRNDKITLEYPSVTDMQERIQAVLKTLYLLFNEGYNSSHTEKLIREDLCEEAMRLNILLTENEKTNLPQANALLALMCYQSSRFDTRLDDKGEIVLLKDQHRGKWNTFLIEQGNKHLNSAASGDMIHEFHTEAAIAALHANAASYEETNWQAILNLYNLLHTQTNNPIVAMNRCIVLGEVEGFKRAIEELKKMDSLQENTYYNISLGEMYLKEGEKASAKKYFEKALQLSSSNTQSDLIKRKLLACN